MTVLRLRPKHSATRLAKLYAKPHDSTRYGRGTEMRVQMTIAFARAVFGDAVIVADLACGDARIARALTAEPILGDLAPGYQHRGPIEATIWDLPPLDLLVLSEALEHLDDPLDVLRCAAKRSSGLLLTTPLEAWGDLWENEEHYWAWDRAGVEELLDFAGWKVQAFATLDTRPLGEQYNYGLWAAS